MSVSGENKMYEKFVLSKKEDNIYSLEKIAPEMLEKEDEELCAADDLEEV